jgi:hypothetical protein
MIIINICLKPLGFDRLFTYDRDQHKIKVVFNRHLHVGNVGGEYGYWLLEGNEWYSAGDFPSNPILSGSAPNKY